MTTNPTTTTDSLDTVISGLAVSPSQLPRHLCSHLPVKLTLAATTIHEPWIHAFLSKVVVCPLFHSSTSTPEVSLDLKWVALFHEHQRAIRLCRSRVRGTSDLHRSHLRTPSLTSSSLAVLREGLILYLAADPRLNRRLRNSASNHRPACEVHQDLFAYSLVEVQLKRNRFSLIPSTWRPTMARSAPHKMP
jgi:hypothetical protein